jgi:hypothetical protein
MLVEFARRGIRPDMILFADTGGEKPETCAYLPVIREYLKAVGFPPAVTVRYEPKTAPYRTLEGKCLSTATLPSLAYGGKSCSLKYKVQPQNKLITATYPPAAFVAEGRRVVRALGFDATEGRRTYAGVVKAIGLDAGEQHRLTWAKPKPGEAERKPSREARLDEHFYVYWYPLYSDWHMDRAACERSICGAGLPVSPKSACFYCPASKKHEIVWLREHHPDLLARALAIEENARPNLTSVVGLGRSFAWADFLADLDDTPLFPCGG